MTTCFSKYILHLIFILTFTNCLAQNNLFIENKEKNFINEWLILGPISKYDFEKEIDSSKNLFISPKKDEIYISEKNDTLYWKLLKSNNRVLDLIEIVGNNQYTSTYLFCNLYSDEAREQEILFGSDDGVSIWHNGINIFTDDSARPLFIDHFRTTVNLKKGDNTFLIRVSQFRGGWAYTMRFTKPNLVKSLTPKLYLSLKDIEFNFGFENDRWKFNSGNNDLWSLPDFDDSKWDYVNPTRLDQSYFTNNKIEGWFRLHLHIDSTLQNKPLGLLVWQSGESEFYLDGKLIYSSNFETVQDGYRPVPFTFSQKTDHTIAVKYFNSNPKKFIERSFTSGFMSTIGHISSMTNQFFLYEKTLISYQNIFISLALAVGLLHFILFLFTPKLRQNLYFSIFLFLYAIVIFLDYQLSLAANIEAELYLKLLHRTFWQLFLLSKLRFVYSIFYEKLPKQFWLIALLCLMMILYIILIPTQQFSYADIMFMVSIVEIIRVIVFAIVTKKDGSWIIATAYFSFLVFISFDALIDLGIPLPFSEMRNPYAFGTIAFFIGMSIYLSRNLARTYLNLAEKKAEQKLLMLENERQAKELDEARELQLSMLPKNLPESSNFDIAVYMQTATEVGGDYYDFKLHENGIFTIAIGDATGHGMKAGIMVSAIKSLFNVLSEESSPIAFLLKATKAIKSMGLKKLFMALTIAKLDGNKLVLSSAGMPYALIYRANSKKVEEVELKGMPLGALNEFPYQEKNILLNKDDVILFLSDGFEEMFNTKKELLGQNMVKTFFQECGDKTPNQIKEYLINAGENWADGYEQQDDVTFVIIKMNIESS